MSGKAPKPQAGGRGGREESESLTFLLLDRQVGSGHLLLEGYLSLEGYLFLEGYLSLEGHGFPRVQVILGMAS